MDTKNSVENILGVELDLVTAETGSPSNICFIVDQYATPNAGTEGQLLMLAQGLRERGWRVKFGVFRSSGFVTSGNFPFPVEIIKVNQIRNPKDWVTLSRFLRKVRLEGYRLVHAFFNDASLMVPPLARLHGMVPIISRRDMGFWYSDGLKRLLRFTGRFIEACVCNSSAVKTVTLTEERLSPEKVHVIYNGFRPVEPGQEHPLKKRNESNKVVGVVANLRRIKRLDTLIRAAAELRRQGYPLEVHIIGGEGDDDELPDLARQLEIAAYCHFWGRQMNPAAFISDFDIAVLCSESEGFSNAIIEYMQQAKPVICTRVGGNPEIVQDGVNGFLIDVGHATILADRIAQLLDNPRISRQMGLAGQKRVEKEFSMEAMLDAHEALYSRLSPHAE